MAEGMQLGRAASQDRGSRRKGATEKGLIQVTLYYNHLGTPTWNVKRQSRFVRSKLFNRGGCLVQVPGSVVQIHSDRRIESSRILSVSIKWTSWECIPV